MSHADMISLKLQMGISLSAKIAPNVLLAMWQQLQLESAQTQGNQSGTTPGQDQMTSTPMGV